MSFYVSMAIRCCVLYFMAKFCYRLLETSYKLEKHEYE